MYPIRKVGFTDSFLFLQTHLRFKIHTVKHCMYTYMWRQHTKITWANFKNKKQKPFPKCYLLQ